MSSSAAKIRAMRKTRSNFKILCDTRIADSLNKRNTYNKILSIASYDQYLHAIKTITVITKCTRAIFKKQRDLKTE